MGITYLVIVHIHNLTQYPTMGEINVHITVINTHIFLFFTQSLFIYFYFVKEGTHSFVKLLSQYHKHIFCVVVFILWGP